MARLPNNATKAERLEVHQAKMAGKRFNRENGIFRGESPKIRSMNMANRITSFRSIAQGNRHTGKPHLHLREIARRQRQQSNPYLRGMLDAPALGLAA